MSQGMSEHTLRPEPISILGEIPSSEAVCQLLSEQLREVVKAMTNQRPPKRNRMQNLFHVEFGKKTQTCLEMKTAKELTQLGGSVCQVRADG